MKLKDLSIRKSRSRKTVFQLKRKLNILKEKQQGRLRVSKSESSHNNSNKRRDNSELFDKDAYVLCEQACSHFASAIQLQNKEKEKVFGKWARLSSLMFYIKR